MSFKTRAAVIQKANTTPLGFETPWKLQWEKGYPYNVAILSRFFIELQIHFQSGAPASLCNKMYFGDGEFDLQGVPVCEDCEKPGYQGKGKNNPTFVFCCLAHVFDLVDKDGTSSKGTKFKENPFKIIEVSGGKGQVNFDNLRQAAASDPQYLTFNPEDPLNSVWRMKRLEEGGMQPPSIAPKMELQKFKLKFESLTADNFKKYSEMLEGQVHGLILSGYGNLRKDILEHEGFIFPTEPEAAKEGEAVPAKDGPDPIKGLDS